MNKYNFMTNQNKREAIKMAAQKNHYSTSAAMRSFVVES